MTGRKLEDWEKDDIAELYDQGGVDIKGIADEYGVSVSSIYGVLRKKGIDIGGRRRKMLDDWDDAKIEEFRNDYYVTQMRIHDILMKYGFSNVSQVYITLREFGWKPRSITNEALQGRKEAMDHAVRLYNDTDAPIWQICEETGIHQPDLHKALHRRGVTLRSKRK